MKRAILHIGTEKTGSTSIQQCLFVNRELLARKGWLFPASAGYLSNHKLVVWAKERPEADLVSMAMSDGDAATLAEFKDGFVVDHCNEVLPWLAARRRGGCVVYSSEHLQSRLCSPAEIRRVARLLRPLYERIDVVVYLRRQDRYALSAHGTSVRGGAVDAFDFGAVHAAGPYYDYLALLRAWADVFGDEAMVVRPFERARMTGGDVVTDFTELAGMRKGWPALSLEMPASENAALSRTAEAVLRTFNALPADDARLGGEKPERVRGFLVRELQGLDDGLGRALPARADAEAFLARFRDANREVADRWMGGRGFDERFDEYPEHVVPVPPPADVDARLDALLARSRDGALARAA